MTQKVLKAQIPDISAEDLEAILSGKNVMDVKPSSSAVDNSEVRAERAVVDEHNKNASVPSGVVSVGGFEPLELL